MKDKPQPRTPEQQLTLIRKAVQSLAGSDRPPAELNYLLSSLEELLMDLDEQRQINEALKLEILSLDQRLRRVEDSLMFRALRHVGRRSHSFARRAGQLLLRSPLHQLYLRTRGGPPFAAQYRQWLEVHRGGFVDLPADASGLPGFSILLPVHKPRLDWLRQAIESVIAQTYSNWQLCIAVDGPLALEAAAAINQFVQSDHRIVRVSGRNLGISGALNLALTCAGSDYVALLDQDDLLEPAALAQVAMSLAQEPADVLYSDEGYMSARGIPEQPNFKPSFSPELLLSCMYLGHLLVISPQLLDTVGRFRSRCDGAQDHDLALRIMAAGGRFRHLPKVLYHWRRHPGSTAGAHAAKPYTHDAGRRALQDYLEDLGHLAEVEDSYSPNVHQIRWHAPAGGQASLIIPSRTASLLEPCLLSLRSSCENAEIVLVHHLSDPNENGRIEALANSYKCRRVAYVGEFNYSRMCNQGARAASGDLLVFLNDDIRPTSPLWLQRICGHLGRPHVGVVGGLLRYPDGTIQHAGIALGMANAAGHIGRSLFDSHLFPWMKDSRDVSGVTGACLGIRRDLFDRLGGFDEIFPGNFNDVDLCLRAREAGKSVILDRTVEMTHYENATRKSGHNSGERLLFLRRWNAHVQAGDPFYSPHLLPEWEQPRLST